MEELLALLSGHSETLLYAALFLILVLCGVGLPLPEDIPLITAGFLAFEKVLDLPTALVVALLAILVGDSLIFFIGRKWGLSLLSHRLVRSILPEERLTRVQRYFERYGDRTVFFARFVVGLRAATFWAAGTLNVSYGRFILFDGLAALLSVPAFVLLGWYFGDDIERAMRLLDRIEIVLLIVALVAIGSFVYWEIKRRRHKLN